MDTRRNKANTNIKPAPLIQDSNGWEWLSRLNNAQAVAVILIGSPAMSALFQAVLQVFSQPALPWWGNLVVAVALSIALAIFFVFPMSKSGTKHIGARVGGVLILLIAVGVGFASGVVYAKKQLTIPDQDNLIASIGIEEWGMADGGKSTFIRFNTLRLGGKAKSYNALVIAHISDDSVNPTKDERIDKSVELPFSLGERQITTKLSSATIERMKQLPASSNITMELFVVAVPIQYLPEQIISFDSADSLGVKLLIKEGYTVNVGQLRLN